MNWYFWGFALYALWITPVTANVSLRLGDGVRYRVKLQAAGLPLMKHTQDEEAEDEKKLDGSKAMKGMFSLDAPVLLALLREGHLSRALRAWHIERLYLHGKISQQDAAHTALLFALMRTVLRSLLVCGSIQRKLHGRVQADFQAEGSQLFIRCILAARLGNLVMSAIRFAMAIRQIQSRKEESYAAASH